LKPRSDEEHQDHADGDQRFVQEADDPVERSRLGPLVTGERTV
jgi:hypothetical protein